MADLDDLTNQLSNLTVIEAAKLSKMLEEKWGVSAAAPIAQVVQQGEPVAPVEEKTEFTVVLTGFAPDKKINVIKEVRAATGLGLKEAKELVEAVPKTVKEGITKDDAEKLKKHLEEQGGTIELQ